jgi:hypothetical protein
VEAGIKEGVLADRRRRTMKRVKLAGVLLAKNPHRKKARPNRTRVADERAENETLAGEIRDLRSRALRQPE